MTEEKYRVTVSSLFVQKTPQQKETKVTLKRDTIVTKTGEVKKYKSNDWIPVITVSEPYVSGYVMKKYLAKL